MTSQSKTEYMQEWRSRNRDKYNAYHRAYRKRTGHKYQQLDRIRFPEKAAARLAARRAVLRGELTPQPCEVCGNSCAQKHHDDYSRPLDVRWLCPVHHTEVHHQRLAAAA